MNTFGGCSVHLIDIMIHVGGYHENIKGHTVQPVGNIK